jgi:hypothetical protein
MIAQDAQKSGYPTGNGPEIWGEIDVEALGNSIVRVPNDELVVGARKSCAS